MSQNTFCNNCGKIGHLFHNCKMPITSYGIVAFSFNNDGVPVYLMIRRKDTLGYIDFMRGKYSVQNRHYILNMMKQMTAEEKAGLRTHDFETLWHAVWSGNPVLSQYRSEEAIAREKFQHLSMGILNKRDFYTLTNLLDESDNDGAVWTEAEWGFPKGRRNYQEKDYDCALREFQEETGYDPTMLKNVNNILPFEEIFTGSNYKSYKHKYYLMYMAFNETKRSTTFQTSEVSKLEWKTHEECMESIRSYNLEKKRMITSINNSLLRYKLTGL